jgi:nucleoside 2-deoxyribosyltransferase
LGDLGVNVYTAEHDVRPGEPVHDKIAKAIERSRIVVVLLTDRGYDSKYVHQEIGYAKAKNKLVIPIVTNKTRLRDLGMLQGLEYLEVDEDSPAAALNKLDQRVGALLRQQEQQTQALMVVGAAAILILLLTSGD